MQNNKMLNEENYKRVNRKLFIIQIILLIIWIGFVIGGVLFILYSDYFSPLPGVAMIVMPTFFVGGIELMLFMIRHQRGIHAYQAQAAMPVFKESVYETADVQKELAKNMAEGLNEGNKVIYCSECGAKNFIDAKFCSSCGKEIKRL